MRLLFISLLLLWTTDASIAYSEDIIPIFADYNARPKNWQTDDGEAKGIHIEILEEISKRTGLKFSYHFSPWKRAYVLSEEGRGGIIGFSKTSERERHWDYSDPLYYDELVFVTIKSKEFKFEGLQSLKGMRIGIKIGASYGDDFERAKKEGVFQAVETSNRTGQMQMLTRDRVDAVLLSPGKVALKSVISENTWLTEHKNDFVIISPPYKLDPNYLGLPKSMNKKAVLDQINQAVRDIFKDGTQQKIVERVTNDVIQELE